jgi:Phage integrase family
VSRPRRAPSNFWFTCRLTGGRLRRPCISVYETKAERALRRWHDRGSNRCLDRVARRRHSPWTKHFHEGSGKIFHDFRRTAVRDMVRSGVPQSIAMKISGHKTASMFRRYDISNEDDLREAMLRVERFHEAAQQKVVSIGTSCHPKSRH